MQRNPWELRLAKGNNNYPSRRSGNMLRGPMTTRKRYTNWMRLQLPTCCTAQTRRTKASNCTMTMRMMMAKIMTMRQMSNPILWQIQRQRIICWQCHWVDKWRSYASIWRSQVKVANRGVVVAASSQLMKRPIRRTAVKSVSAPFPAIVIFCVTNCRIWTRSPTAVRIVPRSLRAAIT